MSDEPQAVDQRDRVRADDRPTGSMGVTLDFVAIIGGGVWILSLIMLAVLKSSDAWTRILLLLAVLVLVPLWLRHPWCGISGDQLHGGAAGPQKHRARRGTRQKGPGIGARRPGTRQFLPVIPFAVHLSGVLLVAAFVSPRGLITGMLALPWVLLTCWVALRAAHMTVNPARRQPESLLIVAGCVFLPIGAAWAAANRFGIQPMGFDHEKSLLTAVHFHYAGFILPLAAGLAVARLRRAVAWLVLGLIVAGVPLVAAGITATQFETALLLEPLAVVVMTLGALAVAGLHVRLALRRLDEHVLVRSLWLIGAIALLSGTALALVYGLRVFEWMHAPDIGLMRISHGSLNALGFALPITLAWRIAVRK